METFIHSFGTNHSHKCSTRAHTVVGWCAFVQLVYKFSMMPFGQCSISVFSERFCCVLGLFVQALWYRMSSSLLVQLHRNFSPQLHRIASILFWYELGCLHSFVMFVFKQRFVVLYLHNDQTFCCKIVNYLSFYSENGFPLRTHNWIWTMFNWCQIIQMQWTTNQSNTNKK